MLVNNKERQMRSRGKIKKKRKRLFKNKEEQGNLREE